MKLAFLGSQSLGEEFQEHPSWSQKPEVFPDPESYLEAHPAETGWILFCEHELAAEQASRLSLQADWIFLPAVRRSALEQAKALGLDPAQVGGFIPFSGFLGRDTVEVALALEKGAADLREALMVSGLSYSLVKDRPGLVAARVLAMIINEAYYTVMEGTASREDVDLAMKLGTNYPKGPFEWSSEIGLDMIYALLEGLWEDSRDERYKICPLMKREVLSAF